MDEVSLESLDCDECSGVCSISTFLFLPRFLEDFVRRGADERWGVEWYQRHLVLRTARIRICWMDWEGCVIDDWD